MAVRHGYGKIAGTDALVFAYDTGDTRNSYRGQPTTNYISNPTEEMARGEFGQYRDLAPTFETYGLVPYSLSMDIKVNKPGSVLVYMQNGSTSRHGFVGTWVDATTEYQRFYFENLTPTLNDPSTGASTLATYTGYGSGVNPTVKNIQLELGTHSTPFVNGTRSATQGLLDLTGNSTIDISTTSFNSNAEIEYDGSNDYIYVGSKSYSFPNGATVEQVIKPITLNRYQGFFTLNNYGAGSYINFWMPTNNTMRWEVIGTTSTGYSTINTTTAFQTGQYYHVVGTFDGTTTKIYLNGVLENSQTMTNQPTSMTAQMDVGRYAGDYPSSAQIPVTKFYTRPLTAAEVRNNYNNYKGRFGI